MIIIRVMGGLGNQLQQYALYKKLESAGKEVRLDISWFTDEVQDNMAARRELELCRLDGVSMKIAARDEIERVLGRRYEQAEKFAEKIKRKLKPSAVPIFYETGMYHPELFNFEQKYLVGYWACEKYYADILGQLREELAFPKSANERNAEILRQIQGTKAVSIHVRRGDYLDEENRKMFGGICTEEYYDKAVACVLEREPDAFFYIFSDDSGYVRNKFQGGRFQIVDWNKGKDSLFDMMLMSKCRHNICANSTFSFWGARLNKNPGKMMVRPSIHKNSQICIPDEMKMLWEGWTLISPQGGLI